ncbi:MAG TPA: hypothetical protein VNX60_00795 [Candidatus Acidoferrum sp.]|jgi:hypothetical protein|nr:hypothetical protein [Candidatus Acidoferrum sp.]
MKDRGALRTRNSEKTQRVRNVVVCIALVLATVQLWSDPRAIPADAQVAERFVVALNAGNVQGMVSASGCPFVFRNQEWESVKDGSGFVHGRADDKIFAMKKLLETFFGTLVSKVKIESEKAAANPRPKDSLLADNLKEAPAAWRDLSLFVFLRGFGDVEHVAIIGVDSAHHKVRGLYLN